MWYLQLTIAAFFLARLFSQERGPFRLFAGLREFVGVFEAEEATAEQLNRYMEKEGVALPPTGPIATNELAMLLNCIYCMSVWCAVFVLLLDYLDADALIRLLAVCGGAMLLADLMFALENHGTK